MTSFQSRGFTAGLVRIGALAIMALLAGVVWAAPVTPRTYGAAGNGVANDTSAVQSALNTAKVVHLEGGTYRLTGRVIVPTNGGIVGPGTIVHDFSVSLPPAAPSSADTAILVNGDNTVLSDFTIRKNFIDGSYSYGVIVDTRKQVRLRNLDISGFSARSGILMYDSTDFEVTGCYVHDFMMNTTADMIQDSPAGISIGRCHRGIVANNRVERIEVGPVGLTSISPQRPAYGQQGYQSDCMAVAQCTGVVVQGNTCITSGEGIDMLLSTDCVIAGNSIQDIWFQGIKMLGVSYCAVSGNFVSEAYQGMGLAYHGTFLAEASGNALTSNVFRNIAAPGSFGSTAASRVGWGGVGAAIDLHDVNQCRYNVVTDNFAGDTQAVKTATSVVRNIGGATNVVADNLFTLGITEP